MTIHTRDLVPVSPKGEWWRKSLILPTVFSGKDRPCLFPFQWWGLWFVLLYACAEQLFLFLIDGEALESNSSQLQLRRDRPVCGCISWGTSHQRHCWQCLIWAHSNFYWVFDTSQPHLWMTLFMYSNNIQLKCRYQTQSTAPDLFWKFVGEKLHQTHHRDTGREAGNIHLYRNTVAPTEQGCKCICPSWELVPLAWAQLLLPLLKAAEATCADS